MAKLTINRGSSANDGSGDNLRVGAGKINDNFDEIYTALGDGTTITTSNFATLTGTQTLTNKTLTTPVIEEINGTTITLDSVGDIILDADNNGLVDFKDGGTTYLRVSEVGNDAILKSFISDGNFLIKGNDGGVDTTALTFDMSNAGAATFNDKVILGANKVIEFGDPGETIFGNGTNLNITSGNQTIIDSASTIFLDSNNGVVAYNTGATEYMRVSKSTNDAIIKSSISDGDFAIKGNDGGSEITALTLDMSNAGAATFNSTIAATGLTINSAYTFPTADGSANQVLQTDGSGNLSFATASGGATSLNGLSDVTYETTTENLGIGTNALDSLQVGSPYNPTGNIAIGFNAGTNVSVAGHNILIGYNALCNGCNVGNNVAIGCDALKELPQGTCNTAIGAGALRCQSNQVGVNTAVGAFAGGAITTGCRNTFIGAQSGWKITTYCENTIIGYRAMGNTSATGGHSNTIIGVCAGYSNQAGCNVYIGNGTGYSSTATHNTYVGYRTGLSNTTGPNNTAVGFCALYRNETGSVNTSIGFCAGVEGRGSNNTYLGAYTGGSSSHTGNNNVLIGHSATPSSTTVSNEVTIGSSSVTILRTNGSIMPFTDNAQDLGSTSLQWQNIYTGDLHLSNERHKEGNSVDGTTGNWTIQEGAEDLFIINNKNGKKFKFCLKEFE